MRVISTQLMLVTNLCLWITVNLGDECVQCHVLLNQCVCNCYPHTDNIFKVYEASEETVIEEELVTHPQKARLKVAKGTQHHQLHLNLSGALFRNTFFFPVHDITVLISFKRLHHLKQLLQKRKHMWPFVKREKPWHAKVYFNCFKTQMIIFGFKIPKLHLI